MNYSLIYEAIFEGCAKCGAELSEDQKLCIAGSISGYLSMIDSLGLETVLRNLEKQSNKLDETRER